MTRIFMLATAFFLSALFAQPLAQFPKTVDEAVLVLKNKWLAAKDRDWILRNPKDHVVSRLYRGFGTGVRNEFKLWGNNQELRDSCETNDPEGCSVVILNRLWESVRGDADLSLVRQLDCQFQVAKAIRINPKGFHKLTTGELVKALQSQIDEQLASLATAGTTLCQRSLALEVDGKPDLKCFVDAPFSERPPNEFMTLEAVLDGIGFLNLIRLSHAPPKISLDFARRCQFPTPPYLYGSPRTK
jgi:hypothetical protein